MRLPWSKPSGTKSADPGPVSKSQAALSGPDGDGKEHDLQYWLDSRVPHPARRRLRPSGHAHREAGRRSGGGNRDAGAPARDSQAGGYVASVFSNTKCMASWMWKLTVPPVASRKCTHGS